MYPIASEANLIIQGCMVAVIIGAFYNLWAHTKTYQVDLGLTLRLLGIGTSFIAIGVIERILTGFKIVQLTANLALIQDALTLIGLFFLGLGFSKLARSAKS